MFDLLVFVGALLLLVAPVIAIAALVRSGGLSSRLRSLEAKIEKLERQSAPAVLSPPQTAGTVSAPPQAPEESQTEPAVILSRQARSDEVTSPPTSVVPGAVDPPPPKIGFEERFGTRWVVWVGGIALALGGIFLVRYSIEQGLIGPGVRIMLGALLAAALIAAGEWRRTERQLSLPGVQSANIPSVLTAAGTTVAYATIYAAYALYGFLSPAAAFIFLGVVALATLAAALLHGPALGGLGIIGAYLAPMLVASDEPDYWALYIYLAVVNAAAFALARVRLWYWLALAALVLGALWSWPGIDPIYFSFVAALGAHVFYVVASSRLRPSSWSRICCTAQRPSPARWTDCRTWRFRFISWPPPFSSWRAATIQSRSSRSSCLQRQPSPLLGGPPPRPLPYR